MIRAFLIGVLVVALSVLFAIVCYIGALTLLVLPGEAKTGGAFIIQRAQYLDTPQGRLYPVEIIVGSDTVTYTFVVSK